MIGGGSRLRQLTAGHRFTLKEHFDANGPYVLTSVSHTARMTSDYRSGQTEDEVAYENSFTCIPAALPFRPQRVTPKPVVHGTQTAVVVGPKGEELYTDKYGRVKVQFHWDREGKNDEKSSCWIRVSQPIAGKRWGASFWPRIGQEVVVDYLEGDPDQPIIIGTVYNADQMPGYLGKGPDSKHADDNKVTGFKSNTTKGGKGSTSSGSTTPRTSSRSSSTPNGTWTLASRTMAWSGCRTTATPSSARKTPRTRPATIARRPGAIRTSMSTAIRSSTWRGASSC